MHSFDSEIDIEQRIDDYQEEPNAGIFQTFASYLKLWWSILNLKVKSVIYGKILLPTSDINGRTKDAFN